MDQHQENEISKKVHNRSLGIANTIQNFSEKSGVFVTIIIGFCAFVIVGFTVYSKISLSSNSGYYEIITEEDGGILNERVIDAPRYFDDRLAMIINGSSLMLSDIFRESTSSFSSFDKKISKYSEGTAKEDIKVNFEIAGITKALSAKKVSILKFNLTGTPILKEPYFQSGVKIEDVRPISALNEMLVNKWTLEVTGRVVVKQVTREVRDTNRRIRFFIDVYSKDKSYNSDSIRILSMTKWVVR